MRKTLQERMDHARMRAAMYLAPPALRQQIQGGNLHVNGLIRAREVPFDSHEEWCRWWLPERNLSGQIIAPARMSPREKDRYTVAEKPNILVAGGITQLLTYIGSSSGNAVGFAQYFAIGNIVINQINTNDNALAGEYARFACAVATVSGVQIDVSTFIGSAQGVGTITNAGLFGNGATGTGGSGTMMTKSFFSYPKLNGVPITTDYLLSYI